MTIDTPGTLFVSCNTWDEVERTVTKGTSEGYKAIASATGVILMKDQDLILGAFREMMKTYLASFAQDLTPVMACDTPCGRCVGFAVNTKCGVYLYGVDDHDAIVQALGLINGPSMN